MMELSKIIAEEKERLSHMSLSEMVEEWDNSNPLNNSMIKFLLEEDESPNQEMPEDGCLPSVEPSQSGRNIEGIIQKSAAGSQERIIADIAESSIRQAVNDIACMGREYNNLERYSILAEMLARTGMPKAAAEVLRAAASNCYSENADDMLYIANIQGCLGFSKDAKETIRKSGVRPKRRDDYENACELLGLAIAQANSGLIREALETTKSIGFSSKKSDACEYIISRLVEAGKTKEAMQVLYAMPEGRRRRQIESKIKKMEPSAPKITRLGSWYNRSLERLRDNPRYSNNFLRGLNEDVERVNSLALSAYIQAMKGALGFEELSKLIKGYIEFDNKYDMYRGRLPKKPKDFNKIIFEMVRHRKQSGLEKIIRMLNIPRGPGKRDYEAISKCITRNAMAAEICNNAIFFLSIDKYLKETASQAEHAARYLALNANPSDGFVFLNGLWKELANMYLLSGEVEKASEAASHMKYSIEKCEVLESISVAKAKAGECKSALDTAKEIGNSLIRARAYRRVAEYQAKDGKKDNALEACRLSRESTDSEKAENTQRGRIEEQEEKISASYALIDSLEAQIKEDKEVRLHENRKGSVFLPRIIKIKKQSELDESDYACIKAEIDKKLQRLLACNLTIYCRNADDAAALGTNYVILAGACHETLQLLADASEDTEARAQSANKELEKRRARIQQLADDFVEVYESGNTANLIEAKERFGKSFNQERTPEESRIIGKCYAKIAEIDKKRGDKAAQSISWAIAAEAYELIPEAQKELSDLLNEGRAFVRFAETVKDPKDKANASKKAVHSLEKALGEEYEDMSSEKESVSLWIAQAYENIGDGSEGREKEEAYKKAVERYEKVGRMQGKEHEGLARVRQKLTGLKQESNDVFLEAVSVLAETEEERHKKDEEDKRIVGQIYEAISKNIKDELGKDVSPESVRALFEKNRVMPGYREAPFYGETEEGEPIDDEGRIKRSIVHIYEAESYLNLYRQLSAKERLEILLSAKTPETDGLSSLKEVWDSYGSLGRSAQTAYYTGKHAKSVTLDDFALFCVEAIRDSFALSDISFFIAGAIDSNVPEKAKEDAYLIAIEAFNKAGSSISDESKKGNVTILRNVLETLLNETARKERSIFEVGHNIDKTFSQKKIGPYEVGEILGHGDLTCVYKVKDNEGRFFAIKTIKSKFRGSVSKEFIAAAQVLMAMRNQNTAEYSGFGFDEQEGNYMVMELFSEDWKPIDTVDVPMHAAKAAGVLRQVAASLEYAHRKEIFHGSVRPCKVYYNEKTGQAKLADYGLGDILKLGITKWNEDPQRSKMEAPEDIRIFSEGCRGISAKDDILQLGIMAYALLTDDVKVDVSKLKSSPESLKSLRDIVENMTRMDADSRWTAGTIARKIKDAEEALQKDKVDYAVSIDQADEKKALTREECIKRYEEQKQQLKVYIEGRKLEYGVTSPESIRKITESVLMLNHFARTTGIMPQVSDDFACITHQVKGIMENDLKEISDKIPKGRSPGYVLDLARKGNKIEYGSEVKKRDEVYIQVNRGWKTLKGKV